MGQSVNVYDVGRVEVISRARIGVIYGSGRPAASSISFDRDVFDEEASALEAEFPTAQNANSKMGIGTSMGGNKTIAMRATGGTENRDNYEYGGGE